ncbi:MAG: hypothetical protein WCE23_05595 [Candidatus Binatus sp.]|uniref:hypothetical protein n=1 Tax=Candidatus Binatus sp. TaxID=2811406 RepID=UPI003C739416
MEIPGKGIFALIPMLAAVALLGMPRRALGVCPRPDPPRVCAEFVTSDFVLIGTVVSVKYLPAGLPHRDDGWMNNLRVEKMYRGAPQARLQVYTENNSARFPLYLGHSYLLFVSVLDGIPEIYGCGNSVDLDEAGGTIAEIRKTMKTMGSAVGGSIGGLILDWYSGTCSLKGIVISAENTTSGTYRAIASSDGAFNIHVPPGSYRVKAESPSFDISPFDDSFEPPDHVIIKDGACADVAFTARPKKPR